MTSASSENLSVSEIANRIDSLKREIDDLRGLPKKSDKPWYRDGALLLALVAFLFTVITYRRQDVHDTRVELRNVIKDLYALPAENAEAQIKFKGTALATAIGAGFTGQGLVLSRQAYALAEHLGRDLDDSERVAVAGAIRASDPRLAEKLLIARAISEDDPDDFLAAQRSLGALEIMSRRAELGDNSYQSAEDFFKTRGAGFNPQYILLENTVTEASWAESYIQVGACEKADTHLTAAMNDYRRLGYPPGETEGAQLAIDQSDLDSHCNTHNHVAKLR